MAKQITDDEDKLKRQARRRLIGAVALTTIVVVVLPMVLDNEPKPVGQDIELRIPDKDKAGEFVPIMEMPSAPAALPASAPAPAPIAASAPIMASAPVVVSAPVATNPSTIASPVAAASQVSATPKAPENKAAQLKTENKPTPAKLETKQAEKVQLAPQSGFVVQIGAFSKTNKAHQWQQNLNKQGFKAYTEKIGDKVRVRLGPYATREAANKVRHKLETHDLHPTVVDLAQ